MSNSLGIWQPARASSKKSPKNDLGFLTHLTLHAAERQGKVKSSSRPVPNPDSARIPVQWATPSSPLAPGHHRPRMRTSSAAGTTPRRTRSSKQPRFPGSFFKHVSQAQFRSQAPAWGEQVSKEETPDTRARESFWKCWGGSFQRSLCHPRTGPTSQRNKRLLKLGRTTYPCSSVKWLLVAPHDTSSIRHSNAVLWHRFVFGETFKAKDYQHTSSSPGASYQVQTEGISLKLWAAQAYNYPNSNFPPRRVCPFSNRH